MLAISSTIFFNNTVFALDTDSAATNEMTVQDSQEIYQQKILLVAVSVSVILVAIVISISKNRKKTSTPKAKRTRKK